VLTQSLKIMIVSYCEMKKYNMNSTICVDERYSTTRLATKQKPEIVNKFEDKFETVLFLPEGERQKGAGGLRTKGYFKKSYEDKPLVSIITVVFNGEKYLEETIQSVINQGYDNVEYIIIDGRSTDGTLDIIKKYEDKIDYWVSEKDKGIYDAMNKGLVLSVGEMIGIINADDWYVMDAIEEIVLALQESGADYSVGNIQKIPSKIVARPIFPLITGRIYQEMMYPHISAFIKKTVYKQVGLFDVRYRISADFDMALRIHLRNFRCIYIDAILAMIIEGGISNDTKSKKEYLHIVVRHGKNSLFAYATYSLHLAKYYIIKILPNVLVAKILKVRKSRFQYED